MSTRATLIYRGAATVTFPTKRRGSSDKVFDLFTFTDPSEPTHHFIHPLQRLNTVISLFHQKISTVSVGDRVELSYRIEMSRAYRVAMNFEMAVPKLGGAWYIVSPRIHSIDRQRALPFHA